MQRHRDTVGLGMIAWMALCVGFAGQTAPTATTFAVGGAVKTPLVLSAADLAKMPQAVVTVHEDGGDVQYGGVLLSEILTRAGAPAGSGLRGKALASYVLAEASDGYRVLFSLAECDPAFTDNPILVATQRDGKPLFEYQGPFRLIVEHDKPAARGIRMLTKLTVVQLPN
jgi:DMSO/TMAO reductase YedYZ molybdopterin-dependent catalytic subunit